jgi:hypothetical protein
MIVAILPSMPSLAARDVLLRLSPDRALETLDEAEAWVRERGLVTLLPSCSLPSLFAACHEEPVRAGGRGFAGWPRTKWRWAGELEERGLLYAKLLRGTGVFCSEEVAAAVDPLCRRELARAVRGEHGDACARVVEHLESAGPSLAADVAAELDLPRASLRSVRGRLERLGAVVARGVRIDLPDGGHRHESELWRWDQLRPTPSHEGGLDELVALGVRAAVVAPEREVRSWFSWSAPPDLIERLVAERRLTRPEPGLLATS